MCANRAPSASDGPPLRRSSRSGDEIEIHVVAERVQAVPVVAAA